MSASGGNTSRTAREAFTAGGSAGASDSLRGDDYAGTGDSSGQTARTATLARNMAGTGVIGGGCDAPGSDSSDSASTGGIAGTSGRASAAGPSAYDIVDISWYLFYRFRMRSTHKRTGKYTSVVRDNIKRLEISIKDYLLIGEDPVQLFTFMDHITKEYDSFDVSEAKAFAKLPYVLKATENEQQNSVGSVARREDGGVRCRPQAVQYLLRTYAKYRSINEDNMEL